MFDILTPYVMIGMAGSLVVFLLIFSKWDFPKYLRKVLHLNTKAKAFAAIFICGIVLSVLLSMVIESLGLDPSLTQVLEGVVIGFHCALIPGFLKPQDSYGNAKGTNAGTAIKNNRRPSDNRGRRSKG